ncbi:MAG: DNA repair protein RadA [Candidatus Dormibacteria bacterium]
MAKVRTVFVCSECGHSAQRWEGRCPACEAWNTYVEEVQRPVVARSGGGALLTAHSVALAEVRTGIEERLHLGIPELERVLGGGVVRGSLVLVSGDPGIGKSTLLLQLCAQVSEPGASSLYISGEESLQQVRLRADRLRLAGPGLRLLATNDLDEAVAELERMKPAVAVVDSVQTLVSADVGSTAGSVVQVREVASRMMRFAKTSGTAVFLVGHVNKDGAIAGPRVLEHMVDAVLHLEGDAQGQLRLLRSQKNRFGSTDELGIFEMVEEGLREAGDPSRAFYDEASLTAPGAAVFPALEGTRPLLLEVQCLVSPTPFGLPRRSANGFELNRLHMLLAVLEKRAGIHASTQDVYVNVAGGVRVQEPAGDLALAMSVASSMRDVPLSAGLVIVGEVGLAGEIREGRQLERRLSEASRMGFSTALVGSRGARALGRRLDPMRVVGVPDLRAALAACFK